MDWQSIPILDVGELRKDFYSKKAIEQGKAFSDAAKIVGFVSSKKFYDLFIITTNSNKNYNFCIVDFNIFWVKKKLKKINIIL